MPCRRMSRSQQKAMFAKMGRRHYKIGEYGKGKTIKVLEGHKVEPVKPINKTHSRWAYKIKGFKGLYSLEGCNVPEKKFIYKKL